jgi:hypothetical protein
MWYTYICRELYKMTFSESYIYIYSVVIHYIGWWIRYPSPRSNGPTDQPNPVRPTDWPYARVPRPRHPSDSAPPVRPRAARSIPWLLTPRIPTPRRPTSHCPTSRPCFLHPTRSPVGEHRFLLRLAPRPPPMSAPTSPSRRLSHRRPCLLRPCASQNDWENHKMTEHYGKI